MIDDFRNDDGGELDFVIKRKRRGRPRKDYGLNGSNEGFKITQAELEKMPGYFKPIGPRRDL